MYSLLEASRLLLDWRLALGQFDFRFRAVSPHAHVAVGRVQLHPVQRPEVAALDGRDAHDLDLRPRLSALSLHPDEARDLSRDERLTRSRINRSLVVHPPRISSCKHHDGTAAASPWNPRSNHLIAAGVPFSFFFFYLPRSCYFTRKKPRLKSCARS